MSEEIQDAQSPSGDVRETGYSTSERRLLTVAYAAAAFLRIFDGLAQDENDGTYALWRDADLFSAEIDLRRALTNLAQPPHQDAAK